MAKTIPFPEHFQHVLGEMKEGFWGMCTGRPRQVGKQLSGAALWQRLLAAGFRDPFGTIWLRMARIPRKRLSAARDRALSAAGMKSSPNTLAGWSGAPED
jgi:hypothetical protein